MEPIGAPVASRLEAAAARFVKDNRLAGTSAGVAHGGRLAWSAGVGFADVASHRAPDAGTLYRIASITKTFTGTAIMRLRDAGRLHLDDPVVKFVPELRAATNQFGDIEHVTLRRLLSHESGLQSEPPGTDWRLVRYDASTEHALARAGEISVSVPANTQQKYSNLAFNLLGEIVTRVSGVPYVEYVHDEILRPLGMTSTVFEPVQEPLAGRRATGYSARFLSDDLDVSPPAPATYSEGGLWSCVEDLARWLNFQLGAYGAGADGAGVLSAATLKEMHAPRYIGNEDWSEAWCIAWYARRKADVVWVLHTGSLHGFRTAACFEPKTGVGAIALVNGVADASTLALELGAIARDAAAQLPPRVEAPAPLPDAYRELLGLYFAPDVGMIVRVEWRDGALEALSQDDPELHLVLLPSTEPDTFTIAPGTRQSGEHAVFGRLPDGRVGSVFIAAGTYVRLEPVAQPARTPARR